MSNLSKFLDTSEEDAATAGLNRFSTTSNNIQSSSGTNVNSMTSYNITTHPTVQQQQGLPIPPIPTFPPNHNNQLMGIKPSTPTTKFFIPDRSVDNTLSSDPSSLPLGNISTLSISDSSEPGQSSTIKSPQNNYPVVSFPKGYQPNQPYNTNPHQGALYPPKMPPLPPGKPSIESMGPPPGSMIGPPPGSMMGPPPGSMMGPPPGSMMGPPPGSMGPPPGSMMGPPPGSMMGPPSGSMGPPVGVGQGQGQGQGSIPPAPKSKTPPPSTAPLMPVVSTEDLPSMAYAQKYSPPPLPLPLPNTTPLPPVSSSSSSSHVSSNVTAPNSYTHSYNTNHTRGVNNTNNNSNHTVFQNRKTINTISRIDPSQMPRPPIPPVDLLYQTRSTNQRKIPPVSNAMYQSVDMGCASPRFLRCTLCAPPTSKDVLREMSLPYTLLATPFANCENGEEPVLMVDMNRSNRMDRNSKAELCLGTVEFVDPIFIFAIDVSSSAMSSGFTVASIKAVQTAMSDLPGGAETRVGIITFDTHIHFYVIRRYSKEPLNDPTPTMPIAEWIFPLVTHQDLLDSTLSRIPELISHFQHSYDRHTAERACPTAAIRVAQQALQSAGGRVIIMTASPPSLGYGRMKHREVMATYGTDHEIVLYGSLDTILSHSKGGGGGGEEKEGMLVYKRLAEDCLRSNVCVDVFVSAEGERFKDYAMFAEVTSLTGGRLHSMSGSMTLEQNVVRLDQELLYSTCGIRASEVLMKLRCSYGVRASRYVGKGMYNSSECEVYGIHINRVPLRTTTAATNTSSKNNGNTNRRDIWASIQSKKGGFILFATGVSPCESVCWEFTADIIIVYHPSRLYNSESNTQTTSTSSSHSSESSTNEPTEISIGTGDRALCRFRFLYTPEYIQSDSSVVFREGRTRGVGKVTQVYSILNN
eukprot:gene5066-10143_t